MCLGIPGEIVEIGGADATEEQGGLLQGTVSFGGVRKRICLAYVPEARVGDFAIVHAGFALHLVDQAQANEIFETLALAERAHHEAVAEASSDPGPDPEGSGS